MINLGPPTSSDPHTHTHTLSLYPALPPLCIALSCMLPSASDAMRYQPRVLSSHSDTKRAGVLGGEEGEGRAEGGGGV